MLLPRLFDDDLFDEWIEFPDFSDFDKMSREAEKKLYGRHAGNVMKVDVKENDDAYEMLVDIPGFKKEDISVALDEGFLTITANKNVEPDENKTEKSRYIRHERFSGSMAREFYIGTDVNKDDIKAEFKHGILKLTIPKNKAEIEKKSNLIAIEG